MGKLILEMALLGIAVALTSPGSVVTVIALLSMSSGPQRAVAFIAGWVLAIGVIALLTVFVLHGQDFHSKHTSPSQAASVIEIVLGGFLVAAAAWAYRHPRHKPMSQSAPRWLTQVDRLHPILTIFVGVLMLSYALTLTAAAETLKAHVSDLDATLAGLVFAATSIVTIAAPLVVVVVAPDRSTALLATWRGWVLSHSRAIALIALIVIGAAVMARGAYDLAA
jgi:hypothetical protein